MGPLEIAVAHATTDVPTAAPTDTALHVREHLLAGSFESVEQVAVLDAERLVGLLSIEALLGAPPSAAVAELMDPDPPSVSPHTDQELAAHAMVAHGESSLAVVDSGERFIGLISAHRMLGVLLDEHDEDLARIGGYTAGTARARRAVEEPVSARLVHRLPWLLIGLVGAMLSAVIVGAYEEQIEENVLIALFVPAVVYMADAVGTQTEALLIRALAVGVSVRSIISRELASGLLMGIVTGVAFVPFALVGWGDASLALAVGLALIAACSVATVVAMALPALFQRSGIDPAFGSGPLATVIQDLLSILIYFAVAVPIAS